MLEKQDNETFGFEIQVSAPHQMYYTLHLLLLCFYFFNPSSIKKDHREVCCFSLVVKHHLLSQTYGLQLKDSSAVEMCTFVRKVQEDSAAESAGLSAGESASSDLRVLHIQKHHNSMSHCG